MKEWFFEMALVFRREFRLVLGNVGVLIFFFFLPLVYPLVYAAIYNPEVTRDMPVAVVDNCRTAQSREFVRHADATQSIKICGYASDLAQARLWWKEKKCYGVLVIPKDYSERIGRGEQGVVQFYSDVSLLLRYRAFLTSLTELQMATDTQLREESLRSLGVSVSDGSSVRSEAFFLGDPQQGFASFVMPGIVVLILQQSMLLGIAYLAGGANERRRVNGGIDPLAIAACPSATVIGRALCYFTLYIPAAIYILHFVPVIFNLPRVGDTMEYLLFIVPLLLGSAFMGQCLQRLVSERENVFIVVVFTSVLFLFLSGLTWPRYMMQPVWQLLGDIVPATWGVEGFVRINNNGASLSQASQAYCWLWGLTAAYFVISYFVERKNLVRK